MEELLQLTYSYADKAGLNFDPLATKDFLERLAFSCCDRWGLVIELLIETLILTQVAGEKDCSIYRFSQAFAKKYSTPTGYSPFTVPNYRDSFDHVILLQALKKSC